MIREDLLDFQYYLDRLSKFIKESYGIDQQMELFQNLLVQMNRFYDEVFSQIDIFHNNTISGELLDHVGAIFGCQRKFTIATHNPVTPSIIDNYLYINLNDHDFLTYIKTQIIKQNFDGRRETLQKLYSTYINGKIQYGILRDLRFVYILDRESGRCVIYWDENDPSEDLYNLFVAGYLTIESMGIQYRYVPQNFNQFAYYMESGQTPNTYNKYSQLKYNKLDSEPASLTDIYTITAAAATNTWDDDNIYAKVDSNDYIIVKHKPCSWEVFTSATLANYKVLTIVPATTGADNFYSKEQLGGFYS